MGTKVSGLGVELDFGKHVSQSAPHAHRTARFFHIKGAFINASTGVPDAGKPIKLDAAGKIDSSMMNGGGGNHNLLSATHPDSVVGSPVRGDLIVGNATPKWEKLAVGVTGKFIRSNGSDALWASIAWGDVSKVGSNLTDLATRQHAGLTNVTSDQHHPQSHTLASHSTKPHSALSDVTSDQHHAEVHGHAHGDLSEVTSDQHHPQSHALNSHSSYPHSELSDAPADAHHPQSHTLASHSTRPHSSLTDITSDQHHAQSHGHAHTSLSGVTSDQHHAAAHSHSHVSTTGRTANDHHAQAHSHTHASTTGRTANDHHAQVHALTSHSDFSTYLNQAVKSTSSPSFVNNTLSGTLTANGSANFKAYGCYVNTSASAGNVRVMTSGYLKRSTVSSIKYKDKVKDLELNSALLYNLRPISFNSKCEDDDKNKRFIGLIAEEIEKEFPEIMEYNEEGGAEGYDSQMLATLMLAETQRHEARIAALEAQLNN